MESDRSEFGEPWRFVISHSSCGDPYKAIQDATGIQVLEFRDPRQVERIVACVNFLAGVPTDILLLRRPDGPPKFINDRPAASLTFPMKPLTSKPFAVLK